MSDEEFTLDDNYEIDCRRPSDPVPSLVERIGGHKRQATEAAVKDILKPRFQKGESLKCLDGEEVYAAKCLEIDHDGNQWSYLIHYNGWSKTYDEWMFDDDARLNPMKIQSALLRQGSEHTGPLPEARRPEKTKSSDRKPREKRKNKTTKTKQVAKVYFTTEYERRFRLQINFPHELARILLDDQEFLIRHRKLISLPHRLTVEDILLNFKRTFSIENETIDGMISFFNTLVGCKLLYKFERPAFADYLSKFRTTSENGLNYPASAARPVRVFGFIHLVRYIAYLNEEMCELPADYETIKKSVDILQKLADYLVEELETLYSVQDYENTPPEYHRRAQVIW